MMVKSEYLIVDDFQARTQRVLVLDSDYEFGANHSKAVIDGKEYSFALNSIRNWCNITSNESFKGKTVKFIKAS